MKGTLSITPKSWIEKVSKKQRRSKLKEIKDFNMPEKITSKSKNGVQKRALMQPPKRVSKTLPKRRLRLSAGEPSIKLPPHGYV